MSDFLQLLFYDVGFTLIHYLVSFAFVYRWVQQLHTGYRAHHTGKQGILNEDRIKQLSELGFEFKERILTSAKAIAKKANITEIPFEKRLEQIQKFQQELGHLNVDHRYDHW